MENRPKIDQAAPEKPKAQAGDGNTENAEALEFWYYCDCCGRKVPRHEDRHSCQDCNDFDYCPKCVSDAPLIHPGHAWIIIPAPEPLSEQNKDADAAPEAKMEEPTDEPRCPSCAPVTRILPLLKFVLDSPEKHNRMCIKWPLRLSRTIEATQRGCAFCAFMLYTFFRSSNGEFHSYEEKAPWFARPSEHNKERMELVEHCMGTLTRVKSDRFDFDVFPISSRKGANLWDFDKLTFTLGESNLKIRTREELREARVFHSAGVITAERYVFAATEGIAQLKTWLKTCETHHGTSCRPAPNTLAPPSRLIDVTGGDTLRLVTTLENPTCFRYSALSYVWGGSQPFQTTTLNLSARLSPNDNTSFPLSSLPQTLRDAVLITQHLSIPYLWIDSLCIVQDDAHDKFHELARMGEIYKGAFITLVAARAEGVEEGFLKGRGYRAGEGKGKVGKGKVGKGEGEKSGEENGDEKRDEKGDEEGDEEGDEKGEKDEGEGMPRVDEGEGLWRGLVPIEYRLPNPEAKTFKEARDVLPKGESGTVYLMEESVSMLGTLKDPVAERAWCLQERVLSPRVVSFGRWATWRCNKAVESDGGFYIEEGKVGDPKDKGVRRLTQALVGKGDGDRMDVFRTAQLLGTWRGIVQDYTKRRLTLQADRLPAIAGIAREVARLTGMEYLAGLWKENMLQDLMWVARTQEWWRRPEYAENFPPAPTWSWASVQAPILCDAITEDATPLARVLNCSVESVKGKSTFDLVAGGTVEIRGPFSELDKTDVVTLLKRQDMAPAPPMSNDVQEWYKQMLEDMSTRPQGGEKGEVTEAALPERVFGLLMFERDWTKNRWDVERPKEMETCYFGLLLSKVGGGRFERIGCFYEDTSEFLDQTMQPWEQREVVIV